jgi:hypothetical protein
MNVLKNMSNEEYILYKKWKEIQEFSKYIDKSSIVKANIWTPADIFDQELTIREIEVLDPEIIYVPSANKKLCEEWLLLRTFIHTMAFDQNPGRFLRFLIRDKTTGMYLGVASIGSDIISVSTRDKWIGWKDDVKMGGGTLRNSSIATSVVATQPLGYNFLGGKLIASLLCLPDVSDVWKNVYDDILVGITTTSLYGKHSMYQRIPFWKELGETAGSVFLRPDDDVYEIWHHWIKENEPEKYSEKSEGYGENGPATGVKQKILTLIMKELELVQAHYQHGFKRGVFYAPLYENTREFLRGEITDSKLIRRNILDNGLNSIMDWWRPKAINRYKTMLESKRIKDDILFYNKIVDMSWEETKEKYLSEVGR